MAPIIPMAIYNASPLRFDWDESFNHIPVNRRNNKHFYKKDTPIINTRETINASIVSHSFIE